MLVDVLDTGIGISEEAQDNLFQMNMLKKDSDQITKGVGLGLCIARDVITALGGNIWNEEPSH